MTGGTLNWINEWHARACPQRTQAAFSVQLGCHFEEVAEMVASLRISNATVLQDRLLTTLEELSAALKSGEALANISDRDELLDSLADQIVTAVGVGYRAKMNVPVACIRVDESNWSKFDAAGLPIFDTNGKVTKGVSYLPPNLEGLY